MDLGLNRIWFHDSEIHRVVENPESDELGFEVMYPVDWDNNQFAPRTIVFQDVLRYAVAEGPFAGKPTILEVSQTGEHEGRASVRIETNAGERTLLCTGVEIREGGRPSNMPLQPTSGGRATGGAVAWGAPLAAERQDVRAQPNRWGGKHYDQSR